MWATKVITVKKEDEEYTEESEPIGMEQAGVVEVLTERSGRETKIQKRLKQKMNSLIY